VIAEQKKKTCYIAGFQPLPWATRPMSQTPEPLLSAMAEYGGVTYNRADALQVLAKALAEHAQVVVTQHFGKFKLHFLTFFRKMSQKL
jgi:hypothetical protein